MTGSLARFQSAFVDALLGSDSTLRLSAEPAFAVYRNTVMSGCIDALAANFPSVLRLVGNQWFTGAAATYVRTQPPRDGRMLFYGDGFADFLADLGRACDLPYLADVARIDRFWIEAHAAEDADAVDSAWLASLAPDALGAVHLAPHPAARWRWFADVPAYSIWQRNRQANDSIDTAADELVWHGEGALLARPVDAVTWHSLAAAGCAFLDACADGRSLGEAAEAALGMQPATDVAELLSRLLCAGALTLPLFDRQGAR